MAALAADLGVMQTRTRTEAGLMTRQTWMALGVSVTALAIGYVLRERHEQSRAKAELLTVYASLSADTSPEALRDRVSNADHLFLSDQTHRRCGFECPRWRAIGKEAS